MKMLSAKKWPYSLAGEHLSSISVQLVFNSTVSKHTKTAAYHDKIAYQMLLNWTIVLNNGDEVKKNKKTLN